MGTLLANIGSMTKSTHCGNAGAAGLDAALLARRGFTANRDVFEAHKGIIETYYAKGFSAKRLLAFGKPYRVVDPGHAIKLFPSQYATHFAITAGLEMHAKIGNARRIRSVAIRGPVMNYIDRPAPATGLDGKFSLQYTSAAALLDGSVKIDTFTDRRRHRPDMVGMLGKITLKQDASIPNDLHHMHIELTVTLDDGATHRVVCKGPKGTWGMPLRARRGSSCLRLEDCFGRVMNARKMNDLLARLDRLEKLSAEEIRGVVRLIAGSRQRSKA